MIQKQSSKIPVGSFRRIGLLTYFRNPCSAGSTTRKTCRLRQRPAVKKCQRTLQMFCPSFKSIPRKHKTVTSVLTQELVTNSIICELFLREAVLQILNCTIPPSLHVRELAETQMPKIRPFSSFSVTTALTEMISKQCGWAIATTCTLAYDL